MRQDIIHDPAKISWILNQCNILHLGLTNDHGAYVVPVHYGFTQQNDGSFVIYVHGTGDGEKVAALDAGQPIGFEVDHGHENLVYTPPSPTEFNPSFMSVIGNGLPKRINDPQQKANILRAIIHHYVAKSPVAIIPEEVKDINVWEIKVQNITARVSSPTKSWQQALHLDQPLNRGKHYDANGGLLYDDFADQLEDNSDNNPSDASTGASSTDNHQN